MASTRVRELGEDPSFLGAALLVRSFATNLCALSSSELDSLVRRLGVLRTDDYY